MMMRNKMEEKIIELIDKIYEEQDEDKIYNLIFELYILKEQDEEELIKIIIGMGEEYMKKILKLEQMMMIGDKQKEKWKEFKKLKIDERIDKKNEK